MRRLDQRRMSQLFQSQHGVASRLQLRGIGVAAAIEKARVRSGEWDRPTKRVVRLSGSARTSEQDLMIALLEAGPTSVASHQSAAWLWGFGPVPKRHAVTVDLGCSTRTGAFVLHRLSGPPIERSVWRGFPTTKPLRTLVDLAAVVSASELDDALDAAIARKLVAVDAVKAEVDRLSRKGRNGPGAMRAALARRGLNEGPHPSVLEARLHRLLRAGGITPIAIEVVAGPNGEYRIDSVLDPQVALEVDGHVHHSTPEQNAYDERRRATIRMGGTFLLVYDWRDVMFDGRRLIAECHQALARYGSQRRAN